MFWARYFWSAVAMISMKPNLEFHIFIYGSCSRNFYWDFGHFTIFPYLRIPFVCIFSEAYTLSRSVVLKSFGWIENSSSITVGPVHCNNAETTAPLLWKSFVRPILIINIITLSLNNACQIKGKYPVTMNCAVCAMVQLHYFVAIALGLDPWTRWLAMLVCMIKMTCFDPDSGLCSCISIESRYFAWHV